MNNVEAMQMCQLHRVVSNWVKGMHEQDTKIRPT